MGEGYSENTSDDQVCCVEVWMFSSALSAHRRSTCAQRCVYDEDIQFFFKKRHGFDSLPRSISTPYFYLVPLVSLFFSSLSLSLSRSLPPSPSPPPPHPVSPFSPHLHHLSNLLLTTHAHTRELYFVSRSS